MLETLFCNLPAFSFFDASAFFQWFIDSADYWFVFLFMAIESSFVPFPSELVVPPAAYLAATKGDMNIFLIVLVATAGAIVGALFNYYLALWVGRPVVYKLADTRLAHICLINREKVDKAERYFDEHGASSTLIGRLIPVIRQLISIPAGLAKMNIGKFIVFTGLGALIWNAILGGLGYWLGQTVPLQNLMDKIEQYNSYLSLAGVAILLGCVAFIVYKSLKKRPAEN